MADLHPDTELIVDLALGHLDEPVRGAVVEHLLTCARCRQDHDELATSIEQTLAAVPRKAPPPGFDRAVLDALRSASGQSSAGARPAAGPAKSRRRGVLVAAAAAVAGLAVGVGSTLLVTDAVGPDGSVQEVAAGRPLLTGEGAAVGYVTRSWDGAGWTMVVNVTDGRDGARYVCRLVMADGTHRAVGDWVIDSDRTNSWVVPEPEGEVEAVELVTPEDRVWARVDLG